MRMPEIHADKRNLEVITFICEHTLGRTTAIPPEVVDLRLQPWSRPRLPRDVLFCFGKATEGTVLYTFDPKKFT